MRYVLRLVDPCILTLLLGGWRTIAIELEEGNRVERIDFMCSTLARGTRNLKQGWHVPVLVRDDGVRPANPNKSQVTFIVTPQPTLAPQYVVDLDDLTVQNGAFVQALDGQQYAVGIDKSGFMFDTTVHEMLNDEPYGLCRQLAKFVADNAANSFIERFRQPFTFGPFVRMHHQADESLLVDGECRVYRDLYEIYQEVWGNLDEGTLWAYAQAVGGSWTRPPFAAPLQGAPVCHGTSKDEGLQRYLELGLEHSLVGTAEWSQLGPYLERSYGHPRFWIALHNQGIVDLIGDENTGPFATARAAVSAAWTNGTQPSSEDLSRILGLVRRIPDDPVSKRAWNVRVTDGTEFSGFRVGTVAWPTGMEVDEAIASLEMMALRRLAKADFFPGRWVPHVEYHADQSGNYVYSFVLEPHPDEPTLAQAHWEWANPSHTNESLLQLQDYRTREIRHLFGVHLNVAAYDRRLNEPDYTHFPDPQANLEKIGIGRNRELLQPAHLDGDGIVVGHPDTGIVVPAHGGIAAAVSPVLSYQEGVYPGVGFPQHGTTTASLMIGEGQFWGLQPSGARALLTLAPAAPGIIHEAVRVAKSVILNPVSIVSLSEQIKKFSQGPDGKRVVDIITISLGVPAIMGDATTDKLIKKLRSAFTPVTNRLRQIIELAHSQGVIVCAACGQLTDGLSGAIDLYTFREYGPTYLVSQTGATLPARFPTVIGCAGIQGNTEAWRLAMRGKGVTLSIPVDGGWVCDFDPQGDPNGENIVVQGQGSSYAAPLVASVAAMWLQKYASVLNPPPPAVAPNPAIVFHNVLRSCGLLRVEDAQGNPLPGWGYGILNAETILNYDAWTTSPPTTMPETPEELDAALHP